MNNKIIGIIIALLVLGGLAGAAAITAKKDTATTRTAMPHTHEMMHQANGQSQTEETSAITYKGFAVVQKSITVKKGTTVTWTNEDDAHHDVTPDLMSDDFKKSELFGKGKTYKFTFNKIGTYAYHCSPHPYMKGIIKVTQ